MGVCIVYLALGFVFVFRVAFRGASIGLQMNKGLMVGQMQCPGFDPRGLRCNHGRHGQLCGHLRCSCVVTFTTPDSAAPPRY